MKTRAHQKAARKLIAGEFNGLAARFPAVYRRLSPVELQVLVAAVCRRLSAAGVGRPMKIKQSMAGTSAVGLVPVWCREIQGYILCQK